MPLAIDQLYPIYAFETAFINTLERALDVYDAFDPSGAGAHEVAVDV